MDVEIFINKSVDENASIYYDKAKKSKKKISGIRNAIIESEKKLKEYTKKKDNFIKSQEEKENKKKENKIEWFEKFRWFFTSNNKLVIGGKDATTNEIIIKKHTEKKDLVFHTDMAGSPFMVIKSDNNHIDDIELEETAQFLACYSKAWKLGLSSVDVFYVKPEQVSKEARAGEYVAKGSFMIYGKTNYLHPLLKLSMTFIDGKIYCGPLTAIRSLLKKSFPKISEIELRKLHVNIVQGSNKTSQVAKEIKKKLGNGDLDEIIKMLPSGGCRLTKS